MDVTLNCKNDYQCDTETTIKFDGNVTAQEWIGNYLRLMKCASFGDEAIETALRQMVEYLDDGCEVTDIIYV